eukprot:1103552-Rhodomonas_salina.1
MQNWNPHPLHPPPHPYAHHQGGGQNDGAGGAGINVMQNFGIAPLPPPPALPPLMAMVSTDSRPLEPNLKWDWSDAGIKDLIVELKNCAYQRNNELWVLETDDVRRAAARWQEC